VPETLLRVRLQPRGGANAVDGVRDGEVRARVTAPPAGGAANDALVRLLAKALGVARGRVSIVRGLASRTKLVRIDGLAEEEVLARLGRQP